MARISKLQNITPEVVSKLKEKKVTTLDDLWQMIGPNFETGIKEVSEKTSVDEKQLYEILKQQGDPYNYRLGRFLGRHWREVLALIIIVFLLSALIRHALQQHEVLVVSAPNGLPAFHVITDRDVHPEKRFGSYDSFKSESEVIGSYLLQPISHNAVLLKSQLTSPALNDQLNGREVLTVPIKSTAISSTIVPASRVRLLFSPRNAGDSKTNTTSDLKHIFDNFVINDVIVLSIKRQGDSSAFTMAFKDAEARNKALALLTTSDIVISE